jgi:DNA-binding Lrp family transcriptional regulator
MIKKKDLVIASYMRQDSRMPLTRLSRETGMPVSTVFDRIKAGVGDLILRQTALLDFSKLGYNTRATVLIKVKKETKEQLKDCLMKSFNVNSLYKINNGYDFMADFIFRGVYELEGFVGMLDDKFDVKVKDIHYIIEDLKQESFLACPEMVDALFPAS